jgi:spore maturation protein CgeB
MKLIFFGPSLSSPSSGAPARVLKGLLPGVADRGHQVVYFEPSRDGGTATESTYARIQRYDRWDGVKRLVESEVEHASAVVVTTGFSGGPAGVEWLLDLDVPARVYYSVDPWAELRAFETDGASPWLRADQVEAFDLVFSLAGGPAIDAFASTWGAKEVAPLYETLDPAVFFPHKPEPEAVSDVALVGDSDGTIDGIVDAYIVNAAHALPSHRFVVAGKGWSTASWPDNVEIVEAEGDDGKALVYSSARMVLVPVAKGAVDYALPPELLEPVACTTTCAVIDRPGLDEFFVPGKEILVPGSAQDLVGYLTTMDESTLRAMANNAAKRMLEKYSKLPRSRQFEQRVAKKFFGA